MRILRMGMAGAAMAGVLAAGSAMAGAPETVHWQVDANPGFSPDIVQLTLTGSWPSGHSSMSNPASLNFLAGLTPAQLRAASAQPVSFRMRRDAGEFDCQGVAQAGHGSG